jgi:hypothetical protein
VEDVKRAKRALGTPLALPEILRVVKDNHGMIVLLSWHGALD